MGDDSSIESLTRPAADVALATADEDVALVPAEADVIDLRERRQRKTPAVAEVPEAVEQLALGPAPSVLPVTYPPLPMPIDYDGFDFRAEHEKDTFAVGWSEVGDSVINPACVDAIRLHRPTILRWRVDWDVYERSRRWQPFREPNRFLFPGAYREFFAAVQGAGSTLLIQISTQALDWGWATTNNDVFPGLSWTKPGKAQNYPTNVDATYGVFVRNVVDAALEEGVAPERIVVGAFDQPDVNLAPFGPRLLNRRDLIAKESTWSLSAAWANRWTGGYGPRGRWGQLHEVLGDPANPDNRFAGVRWSTSGVGGRQELLTTSADAGRSRRSPWLGAALAVGNEVLDIRLSLSHQGWNRESSSTYPTGLAEYLVAEVGAVVETWDEVCADQGRPPLQVLWGETGGIDAGRVGPTPAEAREFRRAHWTLAEAYGERYLGTVVRGATATEAAGERGAWWTPTYGSEV
jgi:hypothetical protein